MFVKKMISIHLYFSMLLVSMVGSAHTLMEFVYISHICVCARSICCCSIYSYWLWKRIVSFWFCEKKKTPKRTQTILHPLYKILNIEFQCAAFNFIAYKYFCLFFIDIADVYRVCVCVCECVNYEFQNCSPNEINNSSSFIDAHSHTKCLFVIV